MYKIEKELVDTIVNYLASKPWGEVYKLLQALTQLKEVEEMATPKKVEEPKK